MKTDDKNPQGPGGPGPVTNNGNIPAGPGGSGPMRNIPDGPGGSGSMTNIGRILDGPSEAKDELPGPPQPEMDFEAWLMETIPEHGNPHLIPARRLRELLRKYKKVVNELH